MNNMSNGKSDGLVLLYSKNGVLYPVGLTEEQILALDMIIPIAIPGKLKVITDKPQGKIEVLK